MASRYNDIMKDANYYYREPPNRNINENVVCKSLNIYTHNVGGLRTKTLEFNLKLRSCDHNIIAIQETSLTDTHDDDIIIGGTDYQNFRNDRVDADLTKGGGVLILVKNNIAAKLVTVL